MAQGSNALICPKCGGERVVYYVMIKGRWAVLKVVCPNDHNRLSIRLPLELRDQWLGQVANQIYRCTICGLQVPNPIRIVREGRWMILFVKCPSHGLRDHKRYIIDTIYPLIQNLHQGSEVGGAPPPTFVPPPPPSIFSRVSSSTSPPPPPPPPETIPPPPPPDSDKMKFCNECGSAIQPGALFCVNCGKEIEEDEF